MIFGKSGLNRCHDPIAAGEPAGNAVGWPSFKIYVAFAAGDAVDNILRPVTKALCIQYCACS